MTGSFDSIIDLVQPGEPVASGVVNRPTSDLNAVLQYVISVLKADASKSTLFARSVVIEDAANVGMPVFFNSATKRFERALLSATTDTVTGALVTAESSQVWGVIYSKSQAGLADILLAGFAALDITAGLEAGQTLAAGLYHLSRITPGAMTRTQPPYSAAVLRSDGAGNVYVLPQWTDVATAHSHVHFELKAQPAGDSPAPAEGDPHVITVPDPYLEGWLPADHAVFNGTAPALAVFGYNIPINPGLKAAWPPLPADTAVLVLDGITVDSGESGQVIFDRNGIWWTTDCYGQVPWAKDIDFTAAQISEGSEPSEVSVGDGCYAARTRLDLWFTRFEFLSDSTVVTSLKSTDNRLVITCATSPGTAATTGPLSISLDFTFMQSDAGLDGSQVIKNLDPATQTLQRGPVTEGLYTHSSNVTLAGSISGTRTIASVSRTVVQGLVSVDVSTPDNRELFVQLVRLDGVTEEFDTESVMYLNLPPGLSTSFRSRIHVPESLDVINPVMRLRLRLLALGPGTVPNLTATYLRIPAATTPSALPTSDSALTLVTTFTSGGANTYLDVLSSAITIAPGDDVLITLSRGNADAFIYGVGILRQAGLVTGS